MTNFKFLKLKFPLLREESNLVWLMWNAATGCWNRISQDLLQDCIPARFACVYRDIYEKYVSNKWSLYDALYHFVVPQLKKRETCVKYLLTFISNLCFHESLFLRWKRRPVFYFPVDYIILIQKQTTFSLF